MAYFSLYNKCMKKILFLFFTVVLMAACNKYQTVKIALPDGFIVSARVADTPEKQIKGLMFETHLPENEGMLFVFDKPSEQLFWMKNTLIDLDIVFIDEHKKVTAVAAQVPHSYTYTPDTDVATAQGYGQYVLELAAQTAAKHQLMPGAQLQF